MGEPQHAQARRCGKQAGVRCVAGHPATDDLARRVSAIDNIVKGGTMIVTRYRSVDGFLNRTQDILEANEAANCVMLGACLRLRKIEDRFDVEPYLVAVEDARGLVLAAMMAPDRKVIVYGRDDDVSDAPLTVIRDLISRKRSIPGVLGHTDVASAFARGWADLSGTEFREIGRECVCQYTESVPLTGRPGNLRAATEKDIPLLSRWIHAFHNDLRGLDDARLARGVARAMVSERDVFVWEHGKPLAMAAKVRPTLNGVSISYVYTPPEFRGRGYATACLGRLSRALLKLGWKFCVAHASTDSPAFQHILEKVGYAPISELSEYGFQRT